MLAEMLDAFAPALRSESISKFIRVFNKGLVANRDIAMTNKITVHCSEAVAQRRSLKKVFIKISQNS